MQVPFYNTETWAESQDRIRLKKLAKQHRKHQDTCEKKRKIRKRKKK